MTEDQYQALTDMLAKSLATFAETHGIDFEDCVRAARNWTGDEDQWGMPGFMEGLKQDALYNDEEAIRAYERRLEQESEGYAGATSDED